MEYHTVIGPLINADIELNSHSVVTTTWGEWKKLHPTTQVLSLDTGHRRNYDEGNAYNEYFSTDFLARNPVHHDQIGDSKFVVLTDKSGGNRVYESKDHQFEKLKNSTVRDTDGVTWQIEEEQLTAADGRILNRLPYHRIFWFAWFNTYKNTRLVK